MSLLEPRDDIHLPDARTTIALMANAARRHPKLNLLNLEALAAAKILGATVWLSEQSAQGLLPDVFESEQVPYKIVQLR